MMTATDPDAAALEYLQEEYGEWYRIVRTPHWWKASRRLHDGVVPTIIEDTAAELDAKLDEARRRLERRIGWWDPL